MIEFRVVLDIDDMEKAIAFYTEVLDLQVGRRFDPQFVELCGGPCPIDLLLKKGGTPPFSGAATVRDYRRRWSPVHLDFVVSDIEKAVRHAQAAGAVLEGDIQNQNYGRLALLSDPFGHGFCFLQFNRQGYDSFLKSPR